MKDRGDACSERAVERPRHVLAPLDPLPVCPERPRQGHEVRVDEIGAAHAARVAPLLMHANRPVHAVVGDEDDDRRAVLAGGGELRHAHQEVAVTRDAHDVAVRMDELRGDRGRQPVPHRAREGRELGAVATEGVEAVGPHGEVAGATRDDRVRSEPLAQDGHDVRHLHGAGQRPPLERLEVRGVRRVHVVSAPVERLERVEGSREAWARRDDAERRLVDAAQLVRVRVDVDQRAADPGRRDRREARCLDVAEPRTHDEQDVGVSQPVGQRRVLPDAQVAGVAAGLVVDVVLAPPGGGDGNAALLEPPSELRSGLGRPRLTADDRERSLRLREQPAELGELRLARRRLRRNVGRRVRHLRALDEHVLGQSKHDGAGPPGRRGSERPSDELGDPLRPVDLCDPLRERAEHEPVVELLEGLPPHIAARDLTDEQDHRRPVLERRVHPHRCLRRARAAGHEADPGAAGQLPVRLGHVGRACLVPARDEADRAVAQRVEDVDVALARHAECEIRAVDGELVDEQLPAGTTMRLVRHSGRVIGCSR